MNKLFYIVILLLGFQYQTLTAQLTLEQCQQKARDNYPLVKQYALLGQSEAYSLANLSKGYLPQLSVSAQATYQSDITSLPPELGQALGQVLGREVHFESIDKDQYRLTAELKQLIWDGGNLRSQQQAVRMSGKLEKQKLEVDLYALKERVNQLFFGILALDEQLVQVDLLLGELAANQGKIVAYMQNGMASQPDVDAIRVEQLKVSQRKAELTTARQAFRTMLTAFTGDAAASKAELIKPGIPLEDTLIKRPELKLLELQKELYTSQERIVRAANRPAIGAFLQGGYGNPGLNMLVPGFTPWYMAGARLSWNIGGLYTQKNSLNKIAVNKQQVDIQKETFLFNTRLKAEQVRHDIEKFREQLKSDEEIILLRNTIKKSAESKVENGTLSVTDLLREITAENAARQEKSLREIQLLMAVYQLRVILNY